MAEQQAKGFVFKRVEKKYLLNREQYDALLQVMEAHMQIDEYGLSKICNVYFDTENDELIRTSIEKPPYKEKLRLRSYGVPKPDGKVYLEIKKKYDSIVYKRRIALKLSEAEDYLLRGIRPQKDSQILREIDYFINFYHPIPKLYLAYDRTAYYGKEDADFRMTFDSGIRSRREDLSLGSGDHGTQLRDDDYHLLEIKAVGAYPLWLAKALSELQIFPTSFSKYGSVYKQEVLAKQKNYNVQYEGEQEQCLQALSIQPAISQ
ncbi:MAG: polyphosphate polymerase domain-containing protein [Lachnospiraceae bacterium]|nr:polyphosphate polymerase domain-containing protein [Lachnospiraceae bacterium]